MIRNGYRPNWQSRHTYRGRSLAQKYRDEDAQREIDRLDYAVAHCCRSCQCYPCRCVKQEVQA